MLRLLTSVAAFFLGYLIVSAALGWIQATAGQDAWATVSDWVVVAFGLILAVTLMPRMVEGMRDILAEPATGPVRLPPDQASISVTAIFDAPPVNSSS